MTTPQAILDCLTKLGAVLVDDRLGKDQILSRNAGYMERLQDLDFRDLKAACDKAADTSDRFPTIAQLKKLAKENRELREAAEARDQRAVEDLKQHSAHTRNEAILLCGDFGFHIAELVSSGDPKQEEVQRANALALQNFWAEAASMWERIRPAGGLKQVDKDRHRSRYGFAMEAWARKRLGAPRLPRVYASEHMLTIYRAMTGEEPELSDAPVPLRSGGLARVLTNAVRELGPSRANDDEVRASVRRLNQRTGAAP